MSKSKELSVDFKETAWFKNMLEEAKYAVDEFKTAMVELKYQLEWHKIVFRHKIGELLLKNEDKVESFPELIKYIADELDMSERWIQYAVKLYKVFPNVDKIPEGKSITITRLIKNYLTDGAMIDPKGCDHPTWKEIKIRICTKCGKQERIEK
jgi:hypothetical protein